MNKKHITVSIIVLAAVIALVYGIVLRDDSRDITKSEHSETHSTTSDIGSAESNNLAEVTECQADTYTSDCVVDAGESLKTEFVLPEELVGTKFDPNTFFRPSVLEYLTQLVDELTARFNLDYNEAQLLKGILSEKMAQDSALYLEYGSVGNIGESTAVGDNSSFGHIFADEDEFQRYRNRLLELDYPGKLESNRRDYEDSLVSLLGESRANNILEVDRDLVSSYLDDYANYHIIDFENEVGGPLSESQRLAIHSRLDDFYKRIVLEEVKIGTAIGLAFDQELNDFVLLGAGNPALSRLRMRVRNELDSALKEEKDDLLNSGTTESNNSG